MARLQPEVWKIIRQRWEEDPEASFRTVIADLGLKVSPQAVGQKARKEEWAKKAHLPSLSDDPKKLSGREKVSDSKVSGKKGPKGRKDGAYQSNQSNSFDSKGGAGEAISGNPSKEELSARMEIFVREYMIDWNATKAAIRTGFSPKTAGQIGWQLTHKPEVAARIRELAQARAKRLGIEADDLTRLWSAMLDVDVNEFVSIERRCCHYCYGKNHEYQHSPTSLQKAQDLWEKQRLQKVKNGLDDPGPFPPYTDEWYDPTKPPNPECPNCYGQGMFTRVLRDTRELSPAARALFMGVEEFQCDLNVKLVNKEKIHEWLAKSLGVWKEKEKEIETKSAIPEMLDAAFNRVMEESRKRTLEMYERRGFVEDVEEKK